MNVEQVLESNSLKQRFVKDTKLPLNLLRNPYFEERLHLYSVIYPDILDKWEVYLNMLKDFDSEQDYFEHYGSVKDGIIDTVKGSEAYDRFNSLDMNQYAVDPELRQLPSKDIFKPTFNKMTFLSLDMKKANFSSMSKFDPAIFSGCETWEDFVSQFTSYEHIINSKYIREASLGNCNPKRHITYEKYLMSCFLKELLTHGFGIGFDDWKERVVFFSNDEVVFNVTDMDSNELYILRTAVPVNINYSIAPIELRQSYFKLFYIPELEGYIEKDLDDGHITPKSINNFLMPFLCRRLKFEEPTDNDKVFMHPNNNNNLLSQFLEVPEFELPEGIL